MLICKNCDIEFDEWLSDIDINYVNEHNVDPPYVTGEVGYRCANCKFWNYRDI